MIAIQEVATEVTQTEMDLQLAAALLVAAEQKRKEEETRNWAFQRVFDSMRKEIPAWLIPCIGEIHQGCLGDASMQIDTPQGTIRISGSTLSHTVHQWHAWSHTEKCWRLARTWEQALALAVEHGAQPMGDDNPF